MGTIIKTNGEKINVEPKNGKHYSLKEMQNIVGGFIEIVYLKDSRIMIVNEEGKVNGLDFNDAATAVLEESYPYSGDFVVGDVLLCNTDEVE